MLFRSGIAMAVNIEEIQADDKRVEAVIKGSLDSGLRIC